ncbi:MAG: hypothetical protein ACVCEJ_09135 [Candidatus Izemoplasmataceae bacterium]
MNIHFRNSTFGFVIYTSVIVIVVLATVFIFWYMLRGYKTGLYDEDTMLGNVYLGGISEDEVIPKMVDRTNEWIGDETIDFSINYQGYEYVIDREIFAFDFDTSLFYLEEGQENALIVNFQGNSRTELLDELKSAPFLEDIQGYVDFDLLLGHILQDVAAMKTFSQKNIEDYLAEDYEEVVGSYSIELPATIDAGSIVERLTEINESPKMVIEEKMLLSLLNDYQEVFDDRELGFMGKAMLGATHETNLIVNQVYYNPIIDSDLYLYVSYPYYGINVNIDRFTDRDFQIFNPNETTYSYVFSVDEGNELIVEIVGLPFVNEIDTEIVITEIPFPTITVNDINLIRNGVNGRYVEVVRTLTDVYGEVISETVLFYEFYPPIEEQIFAQQ